MPLVAIPPKKSWNSHRRNLRYSEPTMLAPMLLATSLINKEGLKGNHGFPFGGQYAL